MKPTSDRFPVRDAVSVRPRGERVRFHPARRGSFMDPTGAMEDTTAFKLPAGALISPIRFDVTDIRIARLSEGLIRSRLGLAFGFPDDRLKPRGYGVEITATVMKGDTPGPLTFSRNLYILEADWNLPEDWPAERVDHFFEAEAVSACIRFAFSHELAESFFGADGRHLIEPHATGQPPGTWERAGDSIPDRQAPPATVDVLHPGD